MPLDHLHTQQLLVLVFKCLFHNQLVPSVFHSYFVHNHDIHNYATRNRSDLHIFVPNSSFGKRRIKYKCSVLWNSFPGHLKVSSTLKLFKKNINKKLSYRRVTARCVLSVVILPVTTQQCRNYLYDKSWPNRWYEDGGLAGGKPTTVELCISPVYRRLAVVKFSKFTM